MTSTIGSRVADSLAAERQVVAAMIQAGRDAKKRLKPTLTGRAADRVNDLLIQVERMAFTPPAPSRLVGATERVIADRVAGRHRPSRAKTSGLAHR